MPEFYTAVEGQQDLFEAATHLSKTTRGRNALRALLAWLDDDGLGLDFTNKEAVLTLLAGAFGSYPGTARDAMREALGGDCQPAQ